MTRTTAWISGVGLALIGVPANADILYDTLPELAPFGNGYRLPGPTSNYRAILSFNGASNVFGAPLDMQAADDFSLASAYLIDRVTVDMTSNPASMGLPGMIMVEFFSDVGGRPADAAQFALSVGSDRLTLEASLVAPSVAAGGFRLGVDLSGLGVELGAGNWWFSVAALDDDAAYQVLRRNDQTTGEAIHFRNGGIAHENGYGLGPIGSYEWERYGDLGSGFGLNGDLNARIEGTAVPAPSALALLGLGALGAARRRR